MVISFVQTLWNTALGTKSKEGDDDKHLWFQDALATRKKLQGVRSRRIETPEVPPAKRESTLHEHLMNEEKLRPTYNTSGLAMAYWKHGESTGNVTLSGSKVNRNKHTTVPTTVENPGMGLDLACLNSFLSTTAKQRALTSYYVRSKDQLSNAPYYRAPQSPLYVDQITNAPEAQTPAYEAREEMTGAQEILYNMARDPDVKVRCSIAENENTPIEAMWILLEDESSQVRSKLALNSCCSIPILESLCNDRDPLVSTRANKTLRKVWAEAGSGIANENYEEEKPFQAESDSDLYTQAM